MRTHHRDYKIELLFLGCAVIVCLLGSSAIHPVWKQTGPSLPSVKISFMQGDIHQEFDGKTYRNYYKNGKLQMEAESKNGAIHGLVKTYDQKGRLKSEALYKNGLQAGPLKMYDRFGRVLKTESQ